MQIDQSHMLLKEIKVPCDYHSITQSESGTLQGTQSVHLGSIHFWSK